MHRKQGVQVANDLELGSIGWIRANVHIVKRAAKLGEATCKWLQGVPSLDQALHTDAE